MESAELELIGRQRVFEDHEQTTEESPELQPTPGKVGLWMLAGALFAAYLPMQLVVAMVGLIIWGIVLGATGQTGMIEQLMANPEAALESVGLLWLALVAAAIAAVITLIVAAVWPTLWRFFTTRRIGLGQWVAWRPARRLPLWMVPVITLGVILLVGLVVGERFGPTEVDIQIQLFSTPGLQIVAAVVVSTIVPLAEELIFRGALYEAILPKNGGWKRHIVPFVVTTVLFAGVHLLAGFQTVGSLVIIFLLSAYLTTLRTVTGSVQASVLGHLVWNATAAIGLLVASVVPI
jgi:membrane protease YdiL (CAAX protease family)